MDVWQMDDQVDRWTDIWAIMGIKSALHCSEDNQIKIHPSFRQNKKNIFKTTSAMFYLQAQAEENNVLTFKPSHQS